MFVKDALEKEVGVVVELRGAVWRKFQPKNSKILKQIVRSMSRTQNKHSFYKRLNERIHIIYSCLFKVL